ncbi:MAG: hypothetical protein DIZ80_16200 [endosymbiont of Galathealinum brachiosum]|uniref:HTH lysR-type domain-containing protein n=1 Tax=endosymbiont of Galathealinum brachiosum TaxID=2200906 RepID=A0A370D9N0_9GAMM|nr:MAG: hypothetical protein DIZ80_16200 [endosymbiont of Galathealinum brachiosum]
MNSMDWDGIRFFLAAAETGSLSAAAKKLATNQPTVGRHINSLEESLGVKLFQRSVKGLSLTEEGKRIHEESQQIQSSVVKIQRTVQAESETISGTVKLSLPEGICHEAIMPVLGVFYKQYPDIKLQLDLSSSSANLTRGDADIAIRLFRPKQADLVIKKLGDMQMGLFSSDEYSRNFGSPITLDELKNHRIISYGDLLHNLPENQWLLKHSDKTLNITTSDSTIARLKATLSGCGISIQPVFFKRANNPLVPVLVSEKIPSHEVWLVYHKDLRHLSRMRVALEFLSAHMIKILSP